jgi:hypothetical protein
METTIFEERSKFVLNEERTSSEIFGTILKAIVWQFHSVLKKVFK